MVKGILDYFALISVFSEYQMETLYFTKNKTRKLIQKSNL